MTFHWDYALILVTLGVFIPWRGVARIRKLLALPQTTPEYRLSIYASTIAFQWVLTGIVAWRTIAHGMTADDLGLTIHSPGMTALVGAWILLVLGPLQYMGIRRTSLTPAASKSLLKNIALRLMPQSLTESLAFSALAITASVCEEFLYRGFVYEMLLNGTRSAALAVLGSSLLFALAHLYQGPRGLISTFVLGLLFAGCRVATGNLVPAIAGHLVVDLLAGLVAPRYLALSAKNTDHEEPVKAGPPERSKQAR